MPVPTALLAAAVTLPVLGTNLAPLGPGGSAVPFADVVRGSNGWEPLAEGAQVGADGSLKALAGGSQARLALFSEASGYRPNGVFVVQWDGNGALVVVGGDSVVATDGRIEFEAGPGAVSLVASAREGKAPGAVQVLAPDGSFAIEGFRRVFLQRTQVYGAIRFEAWQPQAAPGPFYARSGVPVPVMASLMASVHAVGCVALGGSTTPGQSEEMAAEWAAALGARSTLIVEMDGSTDELADRAVAQFAIWRKALGPDRTLVRCLRLDAPDAARVESLRGRFRPGDIDAVSIPLMFGQEAASETEAEAASAKVAAAVESLLSRAKAVADQARRARWQLLCHRGGFELADPPGSDAESSARLDEFARSPGLGTALAALLRGWRAVGGATFFHAADCAPIGAVNRSAALEWIEQDTMASPRRAALLEYALFPDR